ncbi:MAG TPA: hypothetical protein VFO95_10365 [Gemmatimonadales bacterium]|nr:hypothetical protein [Gemmatimonadales bacterium]
MATVLGGVFAGTPGALGSGLFGLLALAIQLLAGRLMIGARNATLQQLMKRWGAGMGLRLLGVILVGVVVWLNPKALAPVPAALGYVGVLIPLLFLEARRI